MLTDRRVTATLTESCVAAHSTSVPPILTLYIYISCSLLVLKLL